MTILVVGASGATGQLLLKQLLERNHKVKAVLRSVDKLPEALKEHKNLSLIKASILDVSDTAMAQHVKDCSAVISCLGHNLNFKGIFGHPRRLVSEATRRLCEAIKTEAHEPVKFILMNTAGNSNRDLQELVSFAQKLVIAALRICLPPHADNEAAADYLRTQIDRSRGSIEWVIVRPDSLLNEDSVSGYELYASPTRSALFNPGKTSRINVAHFMAELLSDEQLWQHWKWQMPVLYNRIVA